MEEQVVSFEVAKLAKEKGFEEFSNKVFNQFGKLFIFNSGLLANHIRINAPTQSLLQKWLREEYKIDIDIRHWSNGYGFILYKNKIPKIINSLSSGFKTYEEALEEGLKEALNLIEK